MAISLYNKKTCSAFSGYMGRLITATEHTKPVSYEVSAPATMFAAGGEIIHCAVCSEVIVTRVIPQDTGSLYAMIGGIITAVIVVIAIILAVSKKRKV